MSSLIKPIWAHSSYLLTDYVFTQNEMLIIQEYSLSYYFLSSIGIASVLLLRAYSLNLSAFSDFSIYFSAWILGLLFALPITYLIAFFKKRKIRSLTIEELRTRKGVRAIFWTNVTKIDLTNANLTIWQGNSKQRVAVGGRSRVREIEQLIRLKPSIPWRIRRSRKKFAAMGLVAMLLSFGLWFLPSASSPPIIIALSYGGALALEFFALGLVVYSLLVPKVEKNDLLTSTSGIEDWLEKKAQDQVNALKDSIDQEGEDTKSE